MLRAGLLFLAGFGAALSAGWWSVPRILYRKEPQPVQFSHIAHTGEKGGMSCEDCHSFRSDGTFAGIPKLETCAACHGAPLGETAAEREFIRKFVEPGIEPQWKVYARQPDNAWFPHSAHVLRGKVACEKCHGGIGKSDRLPAYRVHRITGYPEDVMGKRTGPLGLKRAGGMRMDDCVACHRQNRLGHSCLDCHK